MGVFDKLKNVFFEEEYIEVEEPLKKQKKSIAKKVELSEMPEIKEEKTPREKEIEEEVVERVEKRGLSDRESRKNETFKFPMEFEEDDFKDDSFKEKKDLERTTHNEEPKPLYGGYNYKKDITSVPYTQPGLYESVEYKKEQKIFRPTPIISPIYGVLDKNYKKEEIVQKKEIRLSSENARKTDLDKVREKAYGDLASDITESMSQTKAMEELEKYDEVEENNLYDLNDNDSPVVNKVTVGDAEEYYNDLGLEYNIDYKDNSKEKATGRRAKKEENESEAETEIEDNLFDLIDSMYSSSDKE